MYAKVVSYGKQLAIYLSADLARKIKTEKVLIYAAGGIIILCPCTNSAMDAVCFKIRRKRWSTYITSDKVIKAAMLDLNSKTVDVKFRNNCIELQFSNYQRQTPTLIPKQKLVSIYKIKRSNFTEEYRLHLSSYAYKLLEFPERVEIYANTGVIMLLKSNTGTKVQKKKASYYVRINNAVYAAEIETDLEPIDIEIRKGRLLLIFSNYEGETDLFEV